MSDFDYILGVNQQSSADEIRQAYKKLSLKFHPDKNGGDEFFSERFKEIQAAYETLSDPVKRSRYDSERTASTNQRQAPTNQGNNFLPEIEYFRANKASFEFDEEITFSWKTINSDKVVLKPFGPVSPIGQKTYKIKDFQNPSITVELTAENSSIGRQVRSVMNLKNDTYEKLYQHFKSKIYTESDSSKAGKTIYSNTVSTSYEDKDAWTYLAIFFLIIGVVLLFLYYS